MAAATVAMAPYVLAHSSCSRFLHSSFSSPSSPSLSPLHLPHHILIASPRRRRRRSTGIAASAGDPEAIRSNGEEEAEDDNDDDDDGTEGEDAGFEERLAKLQRRKSGKKAEKRKALKGNSSYASSSSAASNTTKTRGKGSVLLPPIPLQDPISDGFPVELGFNSYTERINGRFAALGIAAILLIELSTGESFLKFHDSSVLTLQIYFLLSCSALFIKYEKEKISVWPKS